MTSSLVGSEMCIRDRDEMDSLKVRKKLPILKLWAQQGSGRSHRNGPVSYTHRTLPTICSV
eukprot:4994624-Prorocentrum_lima.AAC.1